MTDVIAVKTFTPWSVFVGVLFSGCVMLGAAWLGAHFRAVDEAAIVRNRSISSDTNALIHLVEGRQALAIDEIHSINVKLDDVIARFERMEKK
jgi:hypothetical protein